MPFDEAKYAKECHERGFYYDAGLAQSHVDFIQCLTHTKGEWAKKPFILLDWQDEATRKIFGTVDENGYRIIRKAYVEVPKKNGKSEWAAAISLDLLVFDNEPGAEIYSAARDRDQAAIVFNVAAQMVRNNPTLRDICKIIDSTKRIVNYELGAFYHVLSREAAPKHGVNAHGVIFDELHTQPNRDLWDVLTEGAGDARRQPLIFAITTAGYDRHSICWEVHQYAEKVKDGIIDDPNFLPVIFGLPEDQDWEDEANWYKVNPSLGKTITIERLRSAYKEAKELPEKENLFRRLRLNQWTKQETRFIPMSKWDACNGEVNEAELHGRVCYSGLDLSSVSDITALVHIFPPDDDGDAYKTVCRFWIPEEAMEKRSRKDGVPYETWVKQGYINATPGNVIDYKYVLKTIDEDMQSFDIREMAFDRWGATKLIQDLQEMGFENETEKYANRHLIQFGQGFASMNSPTKELLKLIMSGKLIHGGNPVLWWMADNLVVKQDPAGNLKPDKEKSKEKIDGMVALIMALGRATKYTNSAVEVGMEVW